MKKTKRSSILHALCLTVLVCFMFSSCSVEDLAENPDTRLTVDKSTITAIITGTDRSGNKPTINIVANRGFELSCDADWIKPQITSGKGVVSVPIDIDGNDSGSTRVGKLTVKSKEKSEIITITQNLDPDTDDKLEIGHVYLNEDFAWITSDYVNNEGTPIPDYMNDFEKSTTPTIANVLGVAANSALKTKWQEQGWTPYVKPEVTVSVYFVVGALKFGTSSRGGGIISPPLKIAASKTTSVNLTFDVINNISVNDKTTTSPGYGTGTTDNDYMTIEIIGAGTFVDDSKSRDFKIGNIKWNDWQSKSVIVKGIDSDTKFIFRSQNMDNSTGKSRWYLDNVKMVKTTR